MSVKIFHQCQPCQRSCVSTCIAMLLNVPVSVIKDKWHENFWEYKASMRNILDHYGVQYKEFSSLDIITLGENVGTGVFLATVPSLNYAGGFHEVLVQYTKETNEWNIFDPNAQEGYKFYTSNKTLQEERPEEAFKMHSYIIDAFIPEEEVIRLQSTKH